MSITLKRPVIKYVDAEQLDDAMETMIRNDNRILPDESLAPNVWKCRWYNIASPTEQQKLTLMYQRGDAVWINTEDTDTFVAHNYDYIEQIVLENAALRYKYEVLTDEQEKLDFLKKVATGKITGNQSKLPLFYLGTLTSKAQIRVSLSANNDKLPTDNQYWKNFFTDSSSEARSDILSCAVQLRSEYMDAHLKEYHLSGAENAWYDSKTQTQYDLDDLYLHNTLSNITDVQTYVGSKDLAVSRGFDWVVRYCHQSFNGGKTSKWFRVWNSGLVEQGGIVIPNSAYAKAMGDEMTYTGKDGTATCYRVSLSWSGGGYSAPTFNYSTASSTFFQRDQKFDLGDGYGIPATGIGKTVDDARRYTVQLTPMCDSNTTPYSTMRPVDNARRGYYYVTKEVFDMRNDSFCFVLTPGHNLYSYCVRGFVQNSQQAYK